MRDYQIKLEPFTFIALKDLKIIQEVNHHAAADRRYLSGRTGACMAGSGEKTGGTLIQYQETDWEFVRRLAGRSGICLVPDV